MALFFPEQKFAAGIHPSAVIAKSAQVDPTAHIGPGCVTGARVKLGARSVLMGGNHIGRDCTIGEDTCLYPNESTVPTGLIHPAIGGLSFRLLDVVVLVALAARLTTRGIARFGPRGLLWGAFLAWIAKGHAFLGMHSATDTFHGYRPFIAMLGGEFDYHKQQVKVEPKVEDPKHPATRHLGPGLAVLDEIYIMKSFDKARVHVLLSVDKHPNTGEPGYFPLAWTRQEGKGRVFYTAFGHRDDVIEAEWYKKHLLGGIRWALGVNGGR